MQTTNSVFLLLPSNFTLKYYLLLRLGHYIFQELYIILWDCVEKKVWLAWNLFGKVCIVTATGGCKSQQVPDCLLRRVVVEGPPRAGNNGSESQGIISSPLSTIKPVSNLSTIYKHLPFPYQAINSLYRTHPHYIYFYIFISERG